MTLYIIFSVVGRYEPNPTKFHLHLGKILLIPLKYDGQVAYIEVHPKLTTLVMPNLNDNLPHAYLNTVCGI